MTAAGGLLLGAGFAVAPACASPDGLSAEAKRVIARARAASGGDGWNGLRGWHVQGWRRTGVHAERRYEAWMDPLRYGFRSETQEQAGLHIRAFNGQATWEILPSGVVTGADDRPALIQARTQAFLTVNGFFYPQRFTMRGDYLGVRLSQGRAFEVVRLQPGGGKFQELWFDRATHLLGRIVDHDGARPTVTELTDYRKVGPVRVAFRTTVDDGDPARFQERRVEKVIFTPADRDRFSLPPQVPKAAPPAPPKPQDATPTAAKHHRRR